MRQLVFMIFLIVIFSAAHSQVEYFGIDSFIKEDYVETELVIIGSQYFEFKVYGLVLNYSSNVNCRLEGNFFTCESNGKEPINLKLRFADLVSRGVNKNIFAQQFELRQNIDSVSAIVTLPLGMVLSSEKDAAFPPNYRTLSNGRNIIVYWELKNVSAYQPLSFKIEYMPVTLEEGTIVRFLKSFYIAIIIGLFFLGLLIYELLKTKKVVVKKVVRIPKEKIVLEVLDPDEKKIYEIVQKEGRIKQNKLVELTGFSKARVSRVIRKLRDKKLINVEKMGKTNLISLRR